MDPVSQGTFGAGLAQSLSSREKARSAALLGCFAGLAPDLDILISSTADPLLFLEYHRQFTHALIFIPVGALIVAAALHKPLGKGLSFRQSYLFCLLGYATHGLLDTCTTYGTQLLWPFADTRFAWNNISIIDPILTLPFVALVVAGAVGKQPLLARLGFAWAVCYLLFGLVQRDRAETAGYELAVSRGHTPVRLEAKPGFANLILWKVVYETDTHFHVDAVRVGFEQKAYPGDKALKLDVQRDFPWLDPASQQAVDIERFRWFSNNYLAVDPDVPNRVIDVRYSVVPNEIDALWGIDLSPEKGPADHVIWHASRRTDQDQTARWWTMLMGH